jgi:hypothetical protein
MGGGWGPRKVSRTSPGDTSAQPSTSHQFRERRDQLIDNFPRYSGRDLLHQPLDRQRMTIPMGYQPTRRWDCESQAAVGQPHKA